MALDDNSRAVIKLLYFMLVFVFEASASDHRRFFAGAGGISNQCFKRYFYLTYFSGQGIIRCRSNNYQFRRSNISYLAEMEITKT